MATYATIASPGHRRVNPTESKMLVPRQAPPTVAALSSSQARGDGETAMQQTPPLNEIPIPQQKFNNLSPLVSSNLAEGLSTICIKGGKKPFENQPPAIFHKNSNTGTQFADILLEKSLDEYIRSDPYPIPSTEDRAGYHGKYHYNWWLSGLKDYISVKQMLTKQGATLPQNAVILDFGCASGRVLRHFACQEPEMDIWGCDINQRYIEWIRMLPLGKLKSSRIRFFFTFLLRIIP